MRYLGATKNTSNGKTMDFDLAYSFKHPILSSNFTKKKRFCCTNKIICENRDSKNILLQQQNVQFYQQNVYWLLQQNFWLQQQKFYWLSLILLPYQNHFFPCSLSHWVATPSATLSQSNLTKVIPWKSVGRIRAIMRSGIALGDLVNV